MLPPKELEKWILASVNKHFNNAITSMDFYFKNEAEQERKSNYAELRYRGPNFMETLKGQTLIRMDINILVSTFIDTNMYQHDSNVGEVRAAFTDIPIYKYGDGDALIGCIRLIQLSGQGEFLVIHHMGRDPEVGALQSYVQGNYKFYYNL